MQHIRKGAGPSQSLERLIHFGGARAEQANNRFAFPSNSVSTTKYEWWNIVPKNILEQFRRTANFWFLVVSVLQLAPLDLSPTTPTATLVPLCAVLFATFCKDAYEDHRRARDDNRLNCQLCDVLDQDGEFRQVFWKDLTVGEYVRLTRDQPVPCDMILLACSGDGAAAYVDTAQLDGETSLKPKDPLEETMRISQAAELLALEGHAKTEPPNQLLQSFSGMLVLRGHPRPAAVDARHFLLRGSTLRNTDWAYGLTVFTGHDTKLVQNLKRAPSKRSRVEVTSNALLVIVFGLLVLASAVSTATRAVHLAEGTEGDRRRSWVWPEEDSLRDNSWVALVTFMILYNNLIPISLYVTADLVRSLQGLMMELDGSMYHEGTDSHCSVRNSSLNEDLGQAKEDNDITKQQALLAVYPEPLAAAAQKLRHLQTQQGKIKAQLVAAAQSHKELLHRLSGNLEQRFAAQEEVESPVGKTTVGVATAADPEKPQEGTEFPELGAEDLETLGAEGKREYEAAKNAAAEASATLKQAAAAGASVDRALHVLFANVTHFGETVRHYAQRASFDIIGIAEHHFAPERHGDRGHGIAAPGVTFAAHVDSSYTYGVEHDQKDIPVMNWRPKGVAIALICICLDSGKGFENENASRLPQLTRVVKSFAVPRVAFGDWNNTPDQFANIRWLQALGGELLLPAGSPFACTLGRGRLIDYGACTRNFFPLVRYFKVVRDVPWSPRLGLDLAMAARPAAISIQAPRQPIQLQIPTQQISVRKGPKRPSRDRGPHANPTQPEDDLVTSASVGPHDIHRHQVEEEYQKEALQDFDDDHPKLEGCKKIPSFSYTAERFESRYLQCRTVRILYSHYLKVTKEWHGSGVGRCSDSECALVHSPTFLREAWGIGDPQGEGAVAAAAEEAQAVEAEEAQAVEAEEAITAVEAEEAMAEEAAIDVTDDEAQAVEAEDAMAVEAEEAQAVEAEEAVAVGAEEAMAVEAEEAAEAEEAMAVEAAAPTPVKAAAPKAATPTPRQAASATPKAAPSDPTASSGSAALSSSAASMLFYDSLVGGTKKKSSRRHTKHKKTKNEKKHKRAAAEVPVVPQTPKKAAKTESSVDSPASEVPPDEGSAGPAPSEDPAAEAPEDAAGNAPEAAAGEAPDEAAGETPEEAAGEAAGGEAAGEAGGETAGGETDAMKDAPGHAKGSFTLNGKKYDVGCKKRTGHIGISIRMAGEPKWSQITQVRDNMWGDRCMDIMKCEGDRSACTATAANHVVHQVSVDKATSRSEGEASRDKILAKIGIGKGAKGQSDRSIEPLAVSA
ncbi:unnamed protein product [Prorocentrum cordatum]|uniref:P-type ATPase N-terminal domain-containing protein n=1 Tax=Prorocentrum cordatum TaxID=2364126 RepID=A0ABN9W7X4_9DINO|nr:unnamed protein product [Polarella glacialis]